jgi:hypothetical protein
MNTIENELINSSNVPPTTISIIPPTIPTVVTGDSNATSSATLAATAAVRYFSVNSHSKS